MKLEIGTQFEISEDATDWRLTEYDGAETLYYVVDGIIRAV